MRAAPIPSVPSVPSPSPSRANAKAKANPGRRRGWVWLAVVLALALSGCGDFDSASTVARDRDTRPTVDAGSIQDTAQPDASPADTSRAETDTVAALTLLKEDPDFRVPGSVAARSDLVVAGTRAAWVERDDANTTRLVVWQTEWPQGAVAAPTIYTPPNLTHPRQLALGDGHLFYVDDRFGDADLFAIDLSTGADLAIVTLPGAQERPSARGTEVVWQDCRRCVSGDGGVDREIFRRDMADNLGERAVSDNAVADSAPTFGTLADGGLAVAWTQGASVVFKGDDGSSATWALDAEPANVALVQGVLAARPSKVILNPDSMYPSDVWLVDAQSGGVVTATFHAELADTASPLIAASRTAFAWLEAIIPSATGETRVSVVTPAPADPPTFTTTSDLISDDVRSVALSDSRVVFLAPRADNDDLLDVHVGLIE